MDAQWLKTQFTLNPDKTKAGLAEALNLEPPAISKILKGMRQIKAYEYARMREYFGLSSNEADSLAAYKKRTESYILSPLQDGFSDKENANDDSEWVIPAGILNHRTQARAHQIKIFEVKENTMEPDFRVGESVLVDLSEKVPSPPGVFLVSDGYGVMIRQCEYLPGTQPPQIRLSAANKSFHPQILKQAEFTIIGRVIAKLQMV
jgi:hypothetical protein